MGQAGEGIKPFRLTLNCQCQCLTGYMGKGNSVPEQPCE